MHVRKGGADALGAAARRRSGGNALLHEPFARSLVYLGNPYPAIAFRLRKPTEPGGLA